MTGTYITTYSVPHTVLTFHCKNYCHPQVLLSKCGLKKLNDVLPKFTRPIRVETRVSLDTLCFKDYCLVLRLKNQGDCEASLVSPSDYQSLACTNSRARALRQTRPCLPRHSHAL